MYWQCLPPVPYIYTWFFLRVRTRSTRVRICINDFPYLMIFAVILAGKFTVTPLREHACNTHVAQSLLLPSPPCSPCPSKSSSRYTHSFPHCLYLGHPFSYQPAMPWPVLADLKLCYGHLNTRPHAVIAACLASDLRPSPAVPWSTAIAFGPRHWPSPSPDPPPSSNPHPRQAEGIPLTHRLISLIF